MQIRSGIEVQLSQRRYSAIQTRLYHLEDVSAHLVTIPIWRWRLLEQRADYSSSTIEALLSHVWILAGIPSEMNRTSPNASEQFVAELEDAIDIWHDPRNDGGGIGLVPRRYPANQNHRTRASQRVACTKWEHERLRAAEANALGPLPPVDMQPLTPAVASAFAKLFQKQ